jgi:hypothetical protein
MEMVGELVAEKRYRRTTIEMPEDTYKRIKSLAIELNMTMRQIITEALLEKLEREENPQGAQKGIMKSGSLSSKLVKAMERSISREAAITILVRKCEKFGCDPTYLSSEDLDDELLKSICESISHLSGDSEEECLEKLKYEMEVE